LRANGIKFRIESDKGGALVTEGYVVENNELLEPIIQIDKKTLEGLINLFSSIGVTGVGADSLKECAVQVLAAISGENYDYSESIEVTRKKQLGIQFRTKLLEFDIANLAGVNRDERLAIARRIQDAGKGLAQFLDKHLQEFDGGEAVWMPVSELP
jgi:DNA-directed RNA polymerase specialized sigma54-like protein